MERQISRISVIAAILLFPIEVFGTALTKTDTSTMDAAVDWSPNQSPTSVDIGTFDSTISSPNAGNLTLGADLNIGGLIFADSLSGDVLINSGNTLTIGASGIDMSSANRDVTINSSLILGASQGIDIASGRTLTLGGDVDTNNNLLTITVDGTTAVSNVEFSGSITGTGGLTISGAGNLYTGTGSVTLSGTTSNTYTGITTMSGDNQFLYLNKTGGAIAIQGPVTLDNTISPFLRMLNHNQFGSDAVITFTNSGSGYQGNARFELNGHNQTVAGLSASTSLEDYWSIIQNGALRNGDAVAATLTINTAAGTSYCYCGMIRDHDSGSTGVLSLVKTGSGIQRFVGNNYSYTGGTSILEGVLCIEQTGSLPGWDTNGSYTVADGATLAVCNLFSDGNVSTMLGTTNFLAGSNIGFDTENGSRTCAIAITDTSQGELGLEKIGSNALTLSGTNTYTGTTKVTQGTLILSGGSAIIDTGVIELANTAGVTLQLDNDETIGSLSGGGSSGGNVNLQSNTLTLGGSTDITFSGDISGTGSIIKQGTGNLTLSGTNNYSGGMTISDGTLTAQADAELGTGTIKIENASFSANGDFTTDNTFSLTNANSTINTNGSNLTISGNITGTGALKKTGTGNLTLSGSNNYSGGMIISDGAIIAQADAGLGTGTITIGDASFSANGDFTTDNAFNLADADSTINTNEYDLTITGDITGTGSLNKSGTGTLTLDNTTNISGSLLVEEGNLDIASGTSLTTRSGITMGASSTLCGVGTIIGNISSSGKLAPGNSIGTLNVIGDYNFADGSEYEVEVDNSGNSDLLAATGNVTIDSGTTVKVIATETITDSQDYTIITGNSVTGTFTTLDTALLDASLLSTKIWDTELNYQVTQVHLLVEALRFDDPKIANTPLRQQVGAAVQEMADEGGNTLTSELQTLSIAGVQNSYDQLSGQSLAFSHNVSNQAMNNFMNNAWSRMRSANHADNGIFPDSPLYASADGIAVGNGTQFLAEKLWGIWGHGFADHGDRESDGDSSGYNYNTYGMCFGMDYQFTSEWLGGIMFGYADSDLDMANSHDSTQVNTNYFSVYSSYETLEWYLDTIVAYGLSNYKTRRYINAGSIHEKAKGDYDGDQIAGSIEGGLNWFYNNWHVQPLAGFRFIHETQDSFNEKGAPNSNLHVSSSSYDSYQSLLGIKLKTQLQTEITNASLFGELRGRWVHDFGDTSASNKSNFIGYSNTFTVEDKLSRDSAVLGCGLSASVSNNTELFFNYDATINRDYTSHLFSIGLEYRW